MRRSKLTRGRSPLFKIALALFLVVCGGILLLASWRKGGGGSEPDPALEARMRSAAQRVYNIASEAIAASAEVEAANSALDAMDYGRSRRHMQNATEALDNLAERLDGVGAMLRNQTIPRPKQVEAPPRSGK